MVLRALAISVLCFASLSCSAGKKTAAGDRFSGKSYTLGNPLNWAQKKAVMGTDLLLLSPKSGASDEFQENVNVVLENVPSAVSEKEYLALSLKNMKKLMTASNEFSYEPSRIGDQDGFLAHIRHKMGRADLALDSYVVFADNSAYLISCTSLARTYEEFKPKFEKIVATFSLK